MKLNRQFSMGYASKSGQARQALLETESKYRALFELSDDAIMTMNRTGYLDCNQATLDMYGFRTKEEFLDKSTGSLSPPMQPDGRKSFDAAMEYIDLAYRNGRAVFEWLNRRSNGEEFPTEVKLKPINLEGEEVLQVIVRDITHRKRAEAAIIAARDEAESANRAKSEFLARLGRELRIPLDAILGSGQLLAYESDNLTPGQREGLLHIQSSGNQLLHLINGVLAITGVDDGSMALSVEPAAVDPAIEAALSLVRPLASRQGVTVVDPETHGFSVYADQQRLKQVLLNLLSNAVKYSREGDTVRIASEATADDKIRIAVIDTGIGIQEEYHEYLFEPFFRVAESLPFVEGAGLGLTVARKLVGLMGGRIGFDSEHGTGSTFWFELLRT